MNPTPGDRHVNRPLTEMSIAHLQDAEGFVSNKSPVIRSRERSNDYFIFNKGDLHRIAVAPRAALSPAERGGYGLTTGSFRCVRYSLAAAISDEDMNDYDQPLDPEDDARSYLDQQMLMFREYKWAARFFVSAAWDVALDGVAGTPADATEFKQWDASGSTPIEDIHGRAKDILLATGFLPNVLYIGYEVFVVLRNHASIQDRYKANGQGTGSREPVTLAALAELFGVEEVIVSKAVYNTAREGQTASNAFILGKHALLCFVNRGDRPRKKQPTAFVTFAWTGFFGAEQTGFRVKRYREEGIGADILEADSAFVNKVTGSDMARFFSAAVL